MIKFGPAGASNSFQEDGFKHTIDIPLWLKGKQLDCFEYSFGKGVRITSETAQNIGREFAKYNIEISAHAPYYINFANNDPQKAQNNIGYLLDTLKALDWFGGNRCVFHSGSPLKMTRKEAMDNAKINLNCALQYIYDGGFDNKLIGVETMGKVNQLGSIDEVVELCNLDKVFVPCIDFGHVNAREQGVLKCEDDYKKLIDTLIEGVGYEKVQKMHVHFSKIEYSKGGEVRHLTFEDDTFGPNFEPLASVLKMYKLEPYIICESAGTQTEDAIFMKNYYNNI